MNSVHTVNSIGKDWPKNTNSAERVLLRRTWAKSPEESPIYWLQSDLEENVFADICLFPQRGSEGKWSNRKKESCFILDVSAVTYYTECTTITSIILDSNRSVLFCLPQNLPLACLPHYHPYEELIGCRGDRQRTRTVIILPSALIVCRMSYVHVPTFAYAIYHLWLILFFL